jgi:DNA-binding MarR family transcriptional regulator
MNGGRSANPPPSTQEEQQLLLPIVIQQHSTQMPAQKASAPRAQISGARVVPYQPETAKQFGGGARGRTLAIIYRQLSYWSKYAKWKGSGGKKFFYKSQKELAEELGYSEKTINRAIKALRELGLVVVEKLHKRYWRQVNFYFLPHSPFAAAEATTTTKPEPPVSAPAASAAPAGGSFSTTTKPSSLNAPAAPAGGATAVHPAARATATSIRAKSGRGFGQNVRIQQTEYKPLIKQTLQSVVERCYMMAERMKNEQNEDVCLAI